SVCRVPRECRGFARRGRSGIALAERVTTEDETMQTRSIRNALLAAPMLLVAACGQASTQTRSQPGLIAMTTPRTDSPGDRAAPAPARPVERFSETVLRDPAERFALIERLRTRIVNETRQVSDQRWRNEVRPALSVQLAEAGLARSDVEFL